MARAIPKKPRRPLSAACGNSAGMAWGDIASIGFTAVGLVFFVAGTVGLIRFPDVFSRLHALTKADNLGLGFLALGLAFQAPGWTEIAMLAMVWALALVAAGTAAQMVARAALAEGEEDERP